MEFASRALPLDTPRIMGILNVTPDSFSDGGEHYQSNKLSVSSCLATAKNMVAEGASFVDVGGESTRPGAAPVGLQEEMDRVLSVVEAVSQRLDVIVSVDTSSAQLMVEAAKLGAGLINDVRALEKDGALAAAASTGLPVCLMHMQGCPVTMQASPEYRSVTTEVSSYLSSRVEECLAAGINKNKIILDPGIGFGKTDQHNLELLQNIPALRNLGLPILIGVSRKSIIGRMLGRELSDRLAGSLAFALESVHLGANIIRVHDVAETADVMKVFSLMKTKGVTK